MITEYIWILNNTSLNESDADNGLCGKTDNRTTAKTSSEQKSTSILFCAQVYFKLI